MLINEQQDRMQIDESAPMADDSLMMATRTKPAAAAKYKQSMGAKKANHIQVSNDSGHTLSPANATLYRALAAR